MKFSSLNLRLHAATLIKPHRSRLQLQPVAGDHQDKFKEAGLCPRGKHHQFLVTALGLTRDKFMLLQSHACFSAFHHPVEVRFPLRTVIHPWSETPERTLVNSNPQSSCDPVKNPDIRGSAFKVSVIQVQAGQPEQVVKEPIQLQQVLSVMVHMHSFPFSATCAQQMCGCCLCSGAAVVCWGCSQPQIRDPVGGGGGLPCSIPISQLLYMLFPISVTDRLMWWGNAPLTSAQEKKCFLIIPPLLPSPLYQEGILTFQDSGFIPSSSCSLWRLHMSPLPC